MRVLHLFSNHKLTGPAELALDTARTEVLFTTPGAADPPLREEAVETALMSGWHSFNPLWVEDLARERGVRVVRPERMVLKKHFNPYRSLLDARRLARYLDEEPADVLHCHLWNDHTVAALATRGPGSAGRIPIVRTLYEGEPFRPTWRQRWLLRRASDHVVCFSPSVHEALTKAARVTVPGRTTLLDPPIDTQRFRPDRDRRERGRRRLGIAPDVFTAGIVARMQTHRRFEVLLEALRRAVPGAPGMRFVIVGRGTNQETVAREPVRRMGLSSTVIFPGYLEGEDYAEVLSALDLKLFLVPGSDGSCRAVREALACGIPVLAARRGILPTLVRDGVTGRIVEDTVEDLGEALVELATDGSRRREMGRAARQDAVERFGYRRYVAALLDIYDRICG